MIMPLQVDTIHKAYGVSEHIGDISMAEDLKVVISQEGMRKLHDCAALTVFGRG